MERRARILLPLALLAGACSAEQRSLVAQQPFSAPLGPKDPRIPAIMSNHYQISQGGRYFTWFGCSGCHDGAGRDWPRSKRFDQIYAAMGHNQFDRLIAPEQRWQLAAYAATLPKLDPARQRRQAVDQRGEPSAAAWRGPL
jgi:cytochrome c oxidase cbb3-type subunit 3